MVGGGVGVLGVWGGGGGSEGGEGEEGGRKGGGKGENVTGLERLVWRLGFGWWFRGLRGWWMWKTFFCGLKLG